MPVVANEIRHLQSEFPHPRGEWMQFQSLLRNSVTAGIYEAATSNPNTLTTYSYSPSNLSVYRLDETRHVTHEFLILYIPSKLG